MDVRNNATLNLSQLLHHDASDYEVSGEGLLMPAAEVLEADGLRLATPLSWQATVRSTGGDDDFVMDGSVSGTALMECRRCLENVPTELSTTFIYPMIYRPGTGDLKLVESTEDEEDTLAFGRPDVDLTPLLAQLFAIDLPLTALCREDCRGLSADGVNLNEHPDHAAPAAPQPPEPESPFAPLKKLEL